LMCTSVQVLLLLKFVFFFLVLYQGTLCAAKG
jgi:hypothetical protein